MTRTWVIGLALATALAAAGCIEAPTDETETPTPTPGPTTPTGGSCVGPTVGSPPSGGGQSAVSNQPGAFSYSGQVSAKSGKEEFLWSNPSQKAGVSWGGQVAFGSMRLVLFDACNVKVYDSTIGVGQGGMTRTSDGTATPGDWLVQIEFVSFTGQMGLSITSN